MKYTFEINGDVVCVDGGLFFFTDTLIRDCRDERLKYFKDSYLEILLQFKRDFPELFL